MLLHWPNRAVPLADQIGSLNEAKRQGKVRHIGLSNFTRALMRDTIGRSDAPLVTNQIEVHPYLDQSAVISAARKAGLSITAYYGMAEGKVFTGGTTTAPRNAGN